MNKNISCVDGEKLGEYKVIKKKGKFALEEIIEALKSNDADLYFLVIDAREDIEQCYADIEIDNGDTIWAYKDFAIQRHLRTRE